jgi:hypothetical protein
MYLFYVFFQLKITYFIQGVNNINKNNELIFN